VIKLIREGSLDLVVTLFLLAALFVLVAAVIISVMDRASLRAQEVQDRRILDDLGHRVQALETASQRR
jgi:hypothetical protein